MRARHVKHLVRHHPSLEIPRDIAIIGCDNDFDDSMVRRVLDQLRTRYYEPLSTYELARKQGLTPRHVQRRFKAATGKTLQQMLIEIRLEKACALHRDTPLSISEIALDTGFTDLNRFPGYLCKRYGCTPRDYRNQLPKP
ncbi:MAG: helix-turn-helix transcriptional regulator [Verrucomicrobia bacterium]|nr:helix-turn-helix transcriptional regulator [Verrucomicrobiota bacterium]MCH8513122.1 AraC family transcriptional regulator [Kiritimatiellia bacterium]